MTTLTSEKRHQNRPRVSVIVPHYNSPRDLERAISSVLSQTMQDFELIVIDDCSDAESARSAVLTVGSLQDSRVRIIALEVNGGAGAARQAGIRASVGEYLAFLDCDDAWVDWKLEQQVSFMERNPDCFALSCTLTDSSVPIGEAIQLEARRVREYEWLCRNHFTTSATIVRNYDFEFEETLRYSEDFASWIQSVNVLSGAWVTPVPVGWRWKRRFGDGGLSGNLLRMQLGQLKALSRNQVRVPLRPVAQTFAVSWSLFRFSVRVMRVLLWRGREKIARFRSDGSDRHGGLAGRR